MRAKAFPPLVVSLVSCLLLAGAVSAAEAKRDFTLHEVGPGVFAAVGVPGSGAGSNAGFIVGDDGVAVVDTFQSSAAAEQLLAAIRERTKLPIRFVVDTHYHLDHVAGNGVFRDAGAAIVAQRNVRAWERTENLKWWAPNVPPDKRAWVESFVLPNLVYDDGIDLYLGTRRLEVRVLPGHTGSDSIVFVPDADVVFTGDLFWKATLPNTTDADTAAWIATDERLTAEHPTATFVPGHGEVGKAADVAAFRGYLEALRGAVATARQKGLIGDALVSEVRARLAPGYAHWGFYDHFITPNITQMESELAGTKRRPIPVK
jgi:glyoxylase-like metal-dependent hydrolase (beta-lactamase superfamily II)